MRIHKLLIHYTHVIVSLYVAVHELTEIASALSDYRCDITFIHYRRTQAAYIDISTRWGFRDGADKITVSIMTLCKY